VLGVTWHTRSRNRTSCHQSRLLNLTTHHLTTAEPGAKGHRFRQRNPPWCAGHTSVTQPLRSHHAYYHAHPMLAVCRVCVTAGAGPATTARDCSVCACVPVASDAAAAAAAAATGSAAIDTWAAIATGPQLAQLGPLGVSRHHPQPHTPALGCCAARHTTRGVQPRGSHPVCMTRQAVTQRLVHRRHRWLTWPQQVVCLQHMAC
jgi:hypothetical protein